MRWKTLFLIIVFSLLAASALADSAITIEPIKNSITLIETASFQLTISNHALEKQRYSIFSFVQGWDIEPFPLKDKIIEVYPNKSKSTIIHVKPTVTFNPGIYGLALNIESDTGEKYMESLSVYINPDRPLDYLPSIKVAVDMDNEINPRETQTIKLLLENRNPLNMPNLVIKLQSDLSEFNKETVINLAPLERKTVEFTISPSPFQSPGEYFLFFTFEKDGESVKVLPHSINILPLTPPFDVAFELEESFLKTTKQVVIKNLGNIKDTQTAKIPTSFWQYFFTKSTGYSLKENGQRYLAWDLTLQAAEEINLIVVHNYRYPFYFLILLFILVSFYLYIRSPFSLSKSANSITADATLSELKITLHLKNLTPKTLKNVEVIDLVPGIADIGKSLDLGTLKPHEIKHTKKGTLVKWKLAELEPREDRIITYRVRSKLKVVGTLKLPRAKVHQKKKTAYSNTYRISS